MQCYAPTEIVNVQNTFLKGTYSSMCTLKLEGQYFLPFSRTQTVCVLEVVNTCSGS